MPGRSATARKLRAGVLHAARAAAFLSIATGVNSILTALYPRYEPFYAYLISVVVVAWLSSALLGVTTAVVAVILYDWMFAPVRVVPSISFVVPLTVAVALAIATRAAKMPLRPRAALAKPVDPPLLPSVEPPRSVMLRDDARVEDLTRQLAAAEARAEEEAALRAEASVAAEGREAKLTTEMETLRQTIAEQNGRWALSRDELDVLGKRLQEAEARAAKVQQELESSRREADEKRERAARETALREQLEASGQASLQKAVSEVSTKYESALSEAKARAEALQKSVAQLTAKTDAAAAEARKRIDAAQAKADALSRELDRTLASLSEEHARADREAKLRGQLEAAARQTLQRTADVAAGRQREASESRDAARTAALQAAAAEERAAAAQARSEVLLRDSEQLRSQLAAMQARNEEREREIQEARQALEDEGLRVTFESAARQKLADEAATLRQEMERLSGQIEAERNRAAEANAAREAAARQADENLQKIVTGITNDYESAIGEALIDKEAAKAELRKAKKTLDELQPLRGELETAHRGLDTLRSELEAERQRATRLQSEREQMSRDFDEKLKKIVAGITADHEHAIGDSLVEREAAKAELRTMNNRLKALQSAVAEERGRADEEKAARQRLDAEWNEKLQKIVSHLTEDHEADVGEAMLQREAARAEVRSLSARIAALQQTLEQERERFRHATFGSQQEERAGPRRGSSTPTLEEPLRTRPRVVLVVHSDAGTRAMAKHSLEQAGYVVLTAADGLEGLRTATQKKPDVVLAEQVMPKMNARELVQLLKSRAETANVKIILISGSSVSETGADFRADDVIRDPANFNDLKNALENVLAS